MTKKVKSAGRFGARYGRRTRQKIVDIEQKQKAKQQCPYCSKIGGIKRLAAGIFQCKKCNSKFTGKAYYIK
jgi:large subunit ribosomal protein L37Ae